MTTRPAGDRGALLALGFGTTVAMWAAGYVTHLPAVSAPSWLVAVLMVAMLFGGGFAAGRLWQPTAAAGIKAVLLASVLNLLVLGSLLSSTESPNSIVPSALVWLPGSLALGAVLGAAGAMAGARGWKAPSEPRDWTYGFALVAAAATLLLLGVGGLVTSQGAGLAVVDWPNSFGYNMFLYPLARMTGGVYYEHAHRLFGSLVGLTTLVLTVHLFRTEPRAWVRRLSVFALLLVIAQGILGGLRVTGRFTLATEASQTAPSTALAVVHGVTGQIFFGLVVALAIVASRRFRESPPALLAANAGTDRGLGPLLVVALLVQLAFGALLRHHGIGLVVHLSAAAVVATIAVVAGLRAWGLAGRPAEVRRLGSALMVGTALQVLLGFGALIAVGAEPGNASSGPVRAVLATPHQLNGAILLGLAVGLTTWTWRRLAPAPSPATLRGNDGAAVPG